VKSVGVVPNSLQDKGRPSRPLTLRVGRGRVSPDPRTRGRASRSVSRPQDSGSGESERLPTPGLGVGRVGDPPSRGQAHPTPGLGSGEAESQAHPTPGRRTQGQTRRSSILARDQESVPLNTPLSRVSVLYIHTPLLGFRNMRLEREQKRGD